MVTPPRMFRPGGVYLITRRVTQRRFLLRPDGKLTQNFTYLLGCATERFDIEVHSAAVMSSHVHLIVTDPHGTQVSSFVQWLFAMVGRSTNVLRKRKENLWSSAKASIVEIHPSLEDLSREIAYVITNPVKARLVSHAKYWPGLIVLADDIDKKTFRAKRPGYFYKKDGVMPDASTFKATLPACIDATPRQLRALIRERVEAREEWVRQDVRDKGEHFVGVRALERVDVNAGPTSDEESSPQPLVACHDDDIREAAYKEIEAFRQEYADMLWRYNHGDVNVEFPAGTQKMVSFHNCFVKAHHPPPWTLSTCG